MTAKLGARHLQRPFRRTEMINALSANAGKAARAGAMRGKRRD
eukprot:CAMPEP_0197628552 /NCGR_PEP_ID=MMETSP1338-20131121/6811_1 /TAXON_ID=43686 ORGANISM="Pelagodinium beii, Strain RCC1491" /NCGR_SAMPLE_ID=MMETSP1338 /ASSEMBLY_ACC=CAM_ASM_000754 /LENGTH=42 /DNA_ID= /DNA_START= /DNA_END= /DNA_ORIENTATION=